MSERVWTLPETRKPLTRKQYLELFMRQDGRCACGCGQKLEVKGGREATERAKCNAVRDRHIGAKRSRNPLPGSRASNYKRKFDGSLIDRRTGEMIRQFNTTYYTKVLQIR